MLYQRQLRWQDLCYPVPWVGTEAAVVVEHLCVQGRAVDRYTPLVKLRSESGIEEIVTAHTRGIPRWYLPLGATVAPGATVAYLVIPVSSAPSPTPPPPAPPPRARAAPPTPPQPEPEPEPAPSPIVEILELVPSVPAEAGTEEPYPVLRATMHKSYHMGTNEVPWVVERAKLLKVHPSTYIRAALYVLASLPLDEQRDSLRAWQERYKRAGRGGDTR